MGILCTLTLQLSVTCLIGLELQLAFARIHEVRYSCTMALLLHQAYLQDLSDDAPSLSPKSEHLSRPHHATSRRL